MAEAWDDFDNRKILAPLELDAGTQSAILSKTRWPEKHKLTAAAALPSPTAKLLSMLRIPKAAKDYITGIPAVALLAQHVMASKNDLRQIVAEQMEKKGKIVPPEKQP